MSKPKVQIIHVLTLLLSLLLVFNIVGCAKTTSAPTPTQVVVEATPQPQLSDKLYLLNWSDYMDPKIIEGSRRVWRRVNR